MTAVYALASKAFYSPGKPNYTSEAGLVVFRAMTVKNLLSGVGLTNVSWVKVGICAAHGLIHYSKNGAF